LKTPATRRTPWLTRCSVRIRFDPIKMYDEYAEAADGPALVTDTAKLLNDAIRQGKSVMFEGPGTC